MTIEVGESAHLIVSWETTHSGDVECQEGGTLNSYVNRDTTPAYSIWAGTLLRDVCSVVRIDSYYSGSLEPVNDKTAQPPVTIQLTPGGEVFYGDDSFWLNAGISDPGSALLLDRFSCPPLFVKTRASDGSTSLQKAAAQCRVAKDKDGSGRSIEAKIPTRGQGAFAGAETRVEVLALISDPHAPEVRMAGSNPVVLHRVDSSTIERPWGPRVNGLAVSLFLDKHQYTVGEDIPLRLAVENFSAAVDIWTGELPCWAGLTFEVRDSNGDPVESQQIAICSGHGWIQKYPPGKIVPVPGLTLSGLGHLPNHPGDYTVTATWQPCAGDPPASAPPIPYAAVHSAPVAFRVVTEQP